MSEFFTTLVQWQRVHGRSGLPWQGTRDPYRVWLSEIMLQQTQVGTVLAYYPRFLARFPDVQALAAAPVDDVLALWSGLGYYTRARNLHRCAQAVMQDWGGHFPGTAQALQTLPGIGPSTAAAIAAFCFGERISILDGNVKRVLGRALAFAGDLADARQERQLWQHAQALLPPQPSADEMVAYTQGLMDLGAGLCARTRPQCLLCPVAALCQAHQQQRATDFPVKTRKLQRRTVPWCLLALQRADGAIWLQQRPHSGIWAGLYCLPVFDTLADGLNALAPHADALGAPQLQPAFRHQLTHRELVLQPVLLPWHHSAPLPLGVDTGRWVARCSELDIGLPAPVRQWLQAQLPD